MTVRTYTVPPRLGHAAAAILAVGGFRFALTVSGFEDDIARFASMTAIILAAIVYFAGRTPTRAERIIVAYGLVLPYMIVEIVGLGYTWWSGRETIFHAEPYTLGTSMKVHFFGHLIGGITWEPAIVFLLLSALARVWPRRRSR